MAVSHPLTRVKICGIKTPEEALLAAGLGADLIGLNFHPPSPRHVDLEAAKEIADAVLVFRAARSFRSAAPPTLAAEEGGTGLFAIPVQSAVSHLPPPLLVGVFVHHSVAEAAAIGASVGLDLLQLHGDPTPAEVEPVAGHALVALRIDGAPTPADLAPWREIGVWGILLDVRHPELAGGTGQSWDYAAAAGLAQPRERLLIAGGLHAGNLAAAIAAAHPWGVDLCSGLESAPGVRDPQRLREFFATLERSFPST